MRFIINVLLTVMPAEIGFHEIIYPAKYMFDINYLSCQNSGCTYRFTRDTMRLGIEKKRNLRVDTIERMTCDNNILQSVAVLVSLLVSERIYHCALLVFYSLHGRDFFKSFDRLFIIWWWNFEIESASIIKMSNISIQVPF